jgi:hypothetical protein
MFIAYKDSCKYEQMYGLELILNDMLISKVVFKDNRKYSEFHSLLTCGNGLFSKYLFYKHFKILTTTKILRLNEHIT